MGGKNKSKKIERYDFSSTGMKLMDEFNIDNII